MTRAEELLKQWDDDGVPLGFIAERMAELEAYLEVAANALKQEQYRLDDSAWAAADRWREEAFHVLSPFMHDSEFSSSFKNDMCVRVRKEARERQKKAETE